MMERIDLENYEAFFLDFIEGNLSEEQENMLNEFLESHPHLKADLEEYEMIALPIDESKEMRWKSELTREETTGLTRQDYLLIAETEGVISDEEKRELGILMASNPKLEKELSIYNKTKLSATEGEVYADKGSLLRKEPRIIMWWQYASAVAAAVLVMVLLNWGVTDGEYQPQKLAFSKNVFNDRSDTVPQYDFLVREKKIKKQEEFNIVKEKVVKTVRTPDALYASRQPEEKAKNPKVMEQIKTESFDLAAMENKLEKMEDSDHQEQEAEVKGTIDGQMAVVVSQKSKKATEDYLSINEFAKKKIKSDLLKGKTFSETIIEEIAEISNDKIIVKTQKDANGETKKFALNIGKFSISRNK